VTDDEEFANVNGISYTLPALLSGTSSTPSPSSSSSKTDVSTPPPPSSVTSVTASLSSSWHSPRPSKNNLYFAVIYLAPGDYHRFHSPTNWVIESRRHFPGELYSVSPYLQSRLPGLFTLNERVVLLGRWRYGMFSMTPVGATNVGSIKVHFDRELRTNSLARDVTGLGPGGFAEATYRGSSELLGGHPMVRGGEMGGFNLGSTIVLVFEAPGGEGEGGKGKGKGGFRFLVKRGQRIKVGEALGVVE
ncbi:phosphatidylserine decarboxylase-domain-containing protein, partial [Tuber brumale]